VEVSTEEEIVHRKVAVALRRDGIRSRDSLLAEFDNARPTERPGHHRAIFQLNRYG
jgi:hypothetical protein